MTTNPFFGYGGAMFRDIISECRAHLETFETWRNSKASKFGNSKGPPKKTWKDKPLRSPADVAKSGSNTVTAGIPTKRTYKFGRSGLASLK